MPNTESKKQGKILIITKITYFDVDKLAAAVVLGKLLGKQAGKSIDIFAFQEIPLKDLSRIVAPERVNFIQKLEPDYFTISIPRGSAKIKEVKWEETSDKLNLLVFTEEGKIDTQKYSLTQGQPDYDQVVAFGIKTQEEVDKALAQFSPVWHKKPTVNIDLRAENKRYADENFVFPDVTSFAEAVIKFAEQKELTFTNTEATELLASLYWKTNSLRNRYTTQTTFLNAQKLLQLGATLAHAVERVFANLGLVELKARQEIFQSLKLTTDRVAFARITPDTAQMLTTICPINPSKNPLYILRDIDASFILVPVKADETLVLASSRSDRLNLKKLFGAYKYAGDPLQAELTFPMAADQTEQTLSAAVKAAQQAAGPKKSEENNEDSGSTQTQPEMAQSKAEPSKEAINTEPVLQSAEPLPVATENLTPRSAKEGDTSFAPENGTANGFSFPDMGQAVDPLPSAATK